MACILLLTYYYPPCNATGANRPGSLVRNLVKDRHKVIVITRQWTGDEKTWQDQIAGNNCPLKIKKDENSEVHYLPYEGYAYFKNFGFINTFFENLGGNFNYEANYNQYEKYITSILKENTIDYIMISTPPLTTLKVGARMAELFQLPLIVDFRDFENDTVLYKERKYNWLRGLQHKILMAYVKKWMKSAAIVFTASPPLTLYIEHAISKKVFTMNNGFNTSLLAINEKPYTDKFHITVTGTLFEMANLGVMIEACRLIYQRHPGIDIQFNFIGLLINQRVADKFRQVIPAQNLQIIHRKFQQEAMEIASSSHLLMLAGFDEMKGAYTIKIFEYLGLRRNIIQIPGDRDVAEDLIKTTNSGKTPHTAEEAYRDIMSWYDEWKESGNLIYNGKMEEILNWSREKQFEKLAILLKNV